MLLIGDVALAHDLGGLLAARRLGLSLTIVLINNDGGGIFSFLPVATQADAFETARRDTRTGWTSPGPPPCTAPPTCPPATPAGLRGPRSRASLRGGRTTIIEVRTERAANLALHRRIAAR